ncbi:MAG: polysaccharide deacetylase family protein [Deltaproteobacteria bacterium]|nr:polysaccharide deacetylase family protein [Deltaproteobacteria bacterium]
MSGYPGIPVIIYHSIADPHDHPWGFLSLPVAVFERQLAYLKRQGFHTVTLYELSAYLRDAQRLPPKSVIITFDDGFLDNWVHAFPLLKKYGMRATVFVATDFINSADCRRPNLEDVWAGRTTKHELQWWGYLAWSELKAMCASGFIDVQSHSRSHTWHFTSDRIVDFHHPQDPYVWLAWNARPEKKPDWLAEEFREHVPWGVPVYGFEQALLKRRYYEDVCLSRVLADFVQANGGKKYFERLNWRDALHEVASAYRARHGSQAYYESEDEYLQRVKGELESSKRIIEEKLGKAVDFFCWPGGDFTQTLHRLAIEQCGYLATVTTRKRPNRFGDDLTKIDRTYFGQSYRGPFRDLLLFLNFCATVSHQSGIPIVHWVLPLLGNRLMRVLNRMGNRGRRQKPAP